MPRRLKILHTVESYSPNVHGMQEVVRQLSELLAARGHEVHIATQSHPHRPRDSVLGSVRVHSFDLSGNSVTGIRGSSDEIARYQALILDSNFDVITNFAAQQWATDLAYSCLPRFTGAKVFVPTGFSMLYDKEYEWYFKQMPEWLDRYHKVIYLSENYRDSNFARRHNKQNGTVIPNGASEEEFATAANTSVRESLNIPANHTVFLLVGQHTGMKGHREAIALFDRLELRHSTLVIVGDNLSDPQHAGQHNIHRVSYGTKVRRVRKTKDKLRSTLRRLGVFRLLRRLSLADRLVGLPQRCPNCCLAAQEHFHKDPLWKKQNKQLIITSLPREQLVSLYKTADWFLLPSRIECSPIVLFEALAAGLPFFSTDVGTCHELANLSGAGFILPTNTSNGFSHLDIDASALYVNHILSTCDHVALRIKARDFFANGYTWGSISEQYESLYLTLSYRHLEHSSKCVNDHGTTTISA